MIASSKSLQHTQQWSGEFFVPDAYEDRFQGKIEYSPEEGVIFDYRILGDTKPISSGLLHGILEDGRMCIQYRQRQLLGWIVRDMIRHNKPCGIELGFMGHVSLVVVEAAVR